MVRGRLVAVVLGPVVWAAACFAPGDGALSPDASVPDDASMGVDAPEDAGADAPEASVVADADAGTPLARADAGDGGDADEASADSGGAVDAPLADVGSDAPASSCGSWDAEVELDASVPDAAPSVNDDSGAPLPGPPPSVCSLIGDMPAPIEVVNDAPCPIDVWWVDYNCGEQYFATVDPSGGTWFNDTWETHPWRIRQTGSETLLVEIPPIPEGTGDAALRTITYP